MAKIFDGAPGAGSPVKSYSWVVNSNGSTTYTFTLAAVPFHYDIPGGTSNTALTADATFVVTVPSGNGDPGTAGLVSGSNTYYAAIWAGQYDNPTGA